MKSYLPPDGFENYRRCRDDSDSYVTTCPNGTKDWKISKLCEEQPTAFVYGSNNLKYQIRRDMLDTTYPEALYGSIKFQKHHSAYKYRNSYCAACNDAAWLGCEVVRGVDIHYTDIDIWYDFMRKRSKSLVNFAIDLNSRACRMYSDIFMTYTNLETGVDACSRVVLDLRNCPCGTEYDQSEGGCVTIPYSSPSCSQQTSVTTSRSDGYITDYKSQKCRDVIPLNVTEAMEMCSYCTREPNGTDCHRVYIFPEQFNSVTYPSIHCLNIPNSDFSIMAVCERYTPPIRCFQTLQYGAVGSGISGASLYQQTILLNSVAISYDPSQYPLIIPSHTKSKQDLGLELLYASSLKGEDEVCSKYSMVNNSTEIFQICDHQMLVSLSSGRKYKDYVIKGDKLGLCTEYELIGFVLNLRDYILSGISVLVVIIFVVHYFVKQRKTLTSKYVVSSLISLIPALVSFCLTNTFTNKSTACMAIATITQYFMISVHSWTCALALWMVRGLTQLRLVQDTGPKVYLKYALFAWLSPIPFIAASLLLDKYPYDPLYPVYSKYFCFIADGRIRVVVFTGPIYLIILINVLLCIVAITKVMKSGKKVSQADKRRTKKKIMTIVKLQVVFGLHWVLIFFTEIKGPHVPYIWAVLNTLVTLQGVIVVLTRIIDIDSFTKMSRIVRSVSTFSSKTSSFTLSSIKSSTLPESGAGNHNAVEALTPLQDKPV